MTSDDPPARVLALFHARLLGDLRRGAPLAVEQYVALHPAHAELIRAEFDAVLAEARAELACVQAARERPAIAPSNAESASTIESGGSDSPSMMLVRRLALQRDGHAHYEHRDEIARGGMGAIVEVWDELLRRALAMKVMLRSGARSEAMFIEEAQVTGRLDHPGIVPVHELGMGSDGRLYFTMRLVKGQTLKSVIDLMRQGDPEWTQTRVLDVLLKVCDAMAYAHSKGVVHRDIKPANVMVGRFGEVYVMDWGLARVLGTRDRHDMRLRSAAVPAESSIHTLRDEDREATPDSPLVTMDGEVVGTPAYMSPEQADGRIEELGPRSDVYAVGAMLYHVLTGRVPYTPKSGRATSRTILAMLLIGPPQPVHALEPKAPQELVAICEKAMSRDPTRRYADMREMATDLRAYVEHRVVRAYETGAWAESRKWVRRNPGLAAAVVVAFGLLVAVAVVEARGRRAADRQREIALAYADRVSVLSDTALFAQLERRAQSLWPIHPRLLPELDRWLSEAHEAVERARMHAAKLAALRARALPYSDADASHDAEMDPLREQIEVLRDSRESGVAQLKDQRENPANLAKVQAGIEDCDQQIAALTARLGQRRTWNFADRTVQEDHDGRALLVTVAQAFADPDISKGPLADVEDRRARSRTIEARSIEDHRAAWDATIAAIADRNAHPQYAGFEIKPQIGLVPLGPDPDSHYFEFAVLEGGDAPRRGPDGRLVLTVEMGIVLVLLPGGEFLMGAQKTDPTALGYDRAAVENESPVGLRTLEPFFLSKYEMTQAQWLRLSHIRHCKFDAVKTTWSGPLITARHPVETVSNTGAAEILAELGLILPTEAQWEYGARAGTTTSWPTGDTVESLIGYANLPDKSALDDDAESFAKNSPWAAHSDGFPFTAPVGTYSPNAFGLHDMCGNVSEWTRDFSSAYSEKFDPRDGSRPAKGERQRVIRGGNFFDIDAGWSRSARRQFAQPTFTDFKVGVRPARAIDG